MIIPYKPFMNKKIMETDRLLSDFVQPCNGSSFISFCAGGKPFADFEKIILADHYSDLHITLEQPLINHHTFNPFLQCIFLNTFYSLPFHAKNGNVSNTKKSEYEFQIRTNKIKRLECAIGINTA